MNETTRVSTSFGVLRFPRPLFCVLLIFCVAAAIGQPLRIASAADSKRIMLLYSFGRDFKPWSEYARTIRSELDEQSLWPLDVVEHSLVTARSGNGDPEAAFVTYLQSLYSDNQPDLIISFGAPAATFVQQYRARLFPNTPMVFTAVDQRRVTKSELTANDAVVAVNIDYVAALRNISEVLPDTRTIAVVVGTSPIEQFWRREIGKAAKEFEGRIQFRWYDGLTIEQIIKDTASLPPGSAIFWELLIVDGAGAVFEGDTAMQKISATTSAPIFSYDDSFFGQFIVGGPLLSVPEGSKQAAAVAVRILKGEKPGDIYLQPIGFAPPKYDWRELKRWGIPESVLPAGSVVLFREESIWERYRTVIGATFALILFQAGLIGLLLYERHRRKISESEAYALSGKLIGAQENERSRIARELHDDITQRLASLSIHLGIEERQSATPDRATAIRSIVQETKRLSEDVHALSYRLHPSTLTDLGLGDALFAECERFSRVSATELETQIERIGFDIPKDVALALFRITQESLRNVAKHSSAANARVTLQPADEGLRLTIWDDGCGFNLARSTEGGSLGHASMRQRIRLLDGKIDIRSAIGLGTTIAVWVPISSGRNESPAHESHQ